MILKFPSKFKSEVSKEASSTLPHPAFFNNAKNTQITGGFFSININQTVNKIVWFLLVVLVCGLFYLTSSHNKLIHKEQREALLSIIEPVTSNSREWVEILEKRVALNAVLNKGGRVDNPKCHPGTREEVISLIETWMGTRNGNNGFLWLSGPAGGGKTAIMKTIAERSKDQGVYTVNFFFFRGDPTRNSARSFVATLVYQILLLYPATRPAVVSTLSANPLILDASIQEQFQTLIYPLSDIIRESSPGGRPLVLLIDGLDECGGDVNHSQEQVLRALDSLAAQEDFSFLALVASRPEPRIEMVFNQLTSKIQPIFLDDQYRPARDIRRFVTAQFDEILVSHPNAHGVPHDWPSESDIEAIVSKSSGQFIYAATVMRFLEYSPAVPSVSLEKVQGLVPVGKNSPFADLDSVYTHILNQADDFKATQDILALKLLEHHYPCYTCISTIDITSILTAPSIRMAPVPWLLTTAGPIKISPSDSDPWSHPTATAGLNTASILNQADDSKATQDMLASKLLANHYPSHPHTIPTVFATHTVEVTTAVTAASSINMTPTHDSDYSDPWPSPTATPTAGPTMLLSDSADSAPWVPECSGRCFPLVEEFLHVYDCRYTNATIVSALSDLAAIVRLRRGELVFYHASLADFLLDPARSGASGFHVDLKVFSEKIFPNMWKSAATLPNMTADSPPLGLRLIHDIQQTTPAITEALLIVPTPDCNILNCGWYRLRFYHFLSEISRLYYPHDIKSYHQILRKWTIWAVDRYRIPDSPVKVPLLDTYLLLAKLEKWFASRKWNLAANTIISFSPSGVLFLDTRPLIGVKMEKWFIDASQRIMNMLNNSGSHDKDEELGAWPDIWLAILTMTVMLAGWIIVRNRKGGWSAPL